MNSSQAWDLSEDKTEIPGNSPKNGRAVFCTVISLKNQAAVAEKSDPFAPS